MQLILQNGYPFPNTPYEDGKEPELATLTLHGVAHFEWKYVVTVEFVDHQSAYHAKEMTGWIWYDIDKHILEADTSVGDGYDHPAIVVKDKAYCGFTLCFASKPVKPPLLTTTYHALCEDMKIVNLGEFTDDDFISGALKAMSASESLPSKSTHIFNQEMLDVFKANLTNGNGA